MHNALFAAALALLTGCSQAGTSTEWKAEPYVTLENAEWTKNAVLYQINTRQFTKEGTFKAAQKELPRLKALGVDILWIMPIHPIGEKNRKGTLGSPYSVKDYYAVNPEFGTLEEFKAFVKAAHDQDMKVIIDWVANHTAWDNKLATEHPEYYEKDWQGDFRPTPWQDWSDIIDLDWSKPGVRQHVGEAMEYWMREADIDGYRADVAGFVPIDFWNKVRGRLNKIKPVFMLAEWKTPEMHRAAFDASYAWDWHNSARDIARGKANATALYGFWGEQESTWPKEAMRMPYIENHDSNAWEGTQYENFGAALPAMIALSFASDGIPLIHNGQEACNKKRLAFFEKDAIDWGQAEGCDLDELFVQLIAFKKANPALWNGKWGAQMQKLDNDAPQQIFSFVRQKGGNKVTGIFNLSARSANFKITSALADGSYKLMGNGETVAIKQGTAISLKPWEFRLLSANIGK
jgi:1,4-alpha-glucan branching enzyme